jgi:hypothetical protein
VARENLTDLAHGLRYFVVDDFMLITVKVGQFLSSDFQAPLDLRLAFRAAMAQPALQLLEGTAVDEDGDRFGVGLQDRHGALDVDL